MPSLLGGRTSSHFDSELDQRTSPSGLTLIERLCQAIHVVAAQPPAEVLMSVEVDLLMEPGDPDEQRIEAELGRRSSFQAEHGVYVDLVPASFPYLPDGWEERLQDMDVGILRGRCLEVHDLALSKLAAGRLKDNELIAALIGHRLLDVDTVRARIHAIVDPHERATMLARLHIAVDSVG